MISFKPFLLAAALSFGAIATLPARAQTTAADGGDDTTLRAAALASVEAFHQGGMDGMAAAVSHCYAEAKASHDASQWRTCIGMDMAASYIDLGTARLNGSATDPRFSNQQVLARVGTALRAAGGAGDPDGAFHYIDARWESVYQGTDEAAERVYPTATGARLRITSRREPVQLGSRG